MGIMRFNYKSRVLGYNVNISIVYPTERYTFDKSKSNTFAPVDGKRFFPYKEGMKFQTIYLIHGGGDDDTMIYRYTNAERYARETNVMLVSPDVRQSFGINTKYGIKYQTFLSEELPVVIQALFASSPKREDNFIMGFAMGGNVALGTAILHPELFHTCVDISGGIGMTLDTEGLKKELDSDHFRYEFSLFRNSFGNPEDIDNSQLDLYSKAVQYKKEGKELSKFHIICGSEEFIRKRVEQDYKILKEINYDVTYTLADGYDHNWVLWDKYIEIAMREYLPLKGQPIYLNERRES